MCPKRVAELVSLLVASAATGLTCFCAAAAAADTAAAVQVQHAVEPTLEYTCFMGIKRKIRVTAVPAILRLAQQCRCSMGRS